MTEEEGPHCGHYFCERPCQPARRVVVSRAGRYVELILAPEQETR